MKTWIALIVVFISGLVIGVLGSLLFVKSAVLQIISGDFHRVNDMLVNRMDSSLDLTAEQLVEVKRIVYSTNDELSIFREKHRPEAEAIIEKNTEKIRVLLDNKQKQEFEKLVTKFRKLGIQKKK